MTWPSWLYRLVPYLGRRQSAEDLQEELRLHLELERERQREAGLSEAGALRAARRKLGNGTLIRERTRDVWGWRWLDELGRDVRHAVRELRRSPGFTATVVVVLALGIGANTAMFGVVHGVLIRPLPYPDADAIVRVGESFGPRDVSGRMRLSNRSMPLLQDGAESFGQLAAYQERSAQWAGPDGAVALSGASVSPSLFPLLRAAPHLGRLFTEEDARDGPEIDVRVVPLLEEMVGAYRPALLALTAATVLVLLIACINVAGLLLARGVTRRRTLAMRAALGAGRNRLVRQLLTESVALSLCGGVLGLAAAGLVLRGVPALVPGDIARLDQVSLDGVVLAFAAGLSVVVGLLFGAAPAFQWLRLDLVRTLNEGGAGSAGGFGVLRSHRARAALATAQVALALVLLTGAGLLLRSFVQLVTVDRGYDPANVIAATARNPDIRFSPQGMTPAVMMELVAANQRFQEALVREMTRLERLPQVEAVGVSSSLPLAASLGSVVPVRVAGRPAPSDPGDLQRTTVRGASPGYFDALRLRIRDGRTFTRLDAAGSPRVLVVNETLARQLFGGDSAVGQRLLLQGPGSNEPREVVGVVADVLYEGLALTASRAEAFMPLAQSGGTPLIGLRSPIVTVRTVGDPLAVVDFLVEAVAAAHPAATVFDVMTMDARLSTAVAQPRFHAAFVGFFAALAVFLAAFGLYGLLSYTVAQRQGEVGIRMALGAQHGDILGLLVMQGMRLVAVGAVIGIAAAAASSRVLESFLYGIATDDLVTFVAAPVALVVAALFACYVPARRAARIAPMEVLRFE